MGFTVLGLQCGPYEMLGSYVYRMEALGRHLDRELQNGSADLVVFPELMTVPYKCGTYDDSFFDMAEPLDGPTLEWLSKKARNYQTAIVGTLFERETIGSENRYFNTAVIVSPEGDLVGKYRKTHIPKVCLPTLHVDETYYFSAGEELPVFVVQERKIGILICYDRSFPEAARTLAVQGAELIVIPTAAGGIDRAGMWIAECAARARENGVFVMGVNRGGDERYIANDSTEKITHYFGMTAAFDPRGEALGPALDNRSWTSLRVDLDFSQIETNRSGLNFLRDYRPELYRRYDANCNTNAFSDTFPADIPKDRINGLPVYDLRKQLNTLRNFSLHRETEPLFTPRGEQ
ncbi:carbon-nitrogen hydrolase family protein [Effusibacillus dendaii]|uniref:CN hydrolase domain-containing protein n=1 Tax=Effusibacillus dendaii TaxID=2743772 RepID=A0A7I8DBA1_9BACL|nr:carbon-nitrogen hydrolase family protein [Effusibacillus dendaii]BCJ85790.1 hypothetical protein skT53_07750 [Effusibacillus dendaii]